MKSKIAVIVFIYFFVLSAFLLATVVGSRAVTAIAENRPTGKQHVIVIDAGHGGIDGGATSCSGVLESKLNLEIALRLDDLMHLLGYDTRMIRTTDTSIHVQGNTIASQKISDLKERVKIVNSQDAGILISIHQNTFSDSRYSGAQVFYAENKSSQELAKHIQDALILGLNPTSNRQIKKADGIYLLEHIKKTGILIECGFLSNPEEERKLRSTDYQKNLCCVIGLTLANYLANT